VGAFDLHALSTPPAFILDQDQILKEEPYAKVFLKPLPGSAEIS
jgi:hypothetical protein